MKSTKNCEKREKKTKKKRLEPLDIQQTGQTWRCQAAANIGRIIIKANRRSETMFARRGTKCQKIEKYNDFNV